jgi:hypothetical protein
MAKMKEVKAGVIVIDGVEYPDTSAGGSVGEALPAEKVADAKGSPADEPVITVDNITYPARLLGEAGALPVAPEGCYWKETSPTNYVAVPFDVESGGAGVEVEAVEKTDAQVFHEMAVDQSRRVAAFLVCTVESVWETEPWSVIDQLLMRHEELVAAKLTCEELLQKTYEERDAAHVELDAALKTLEQLREHNVQAGKEIEKLRGDNVDTPRAAYTTTRTTTPLCL